MIEIVNFEPYYANAFKQLNEEWIKRYFDIEEADRRMLEHPKECIIDTGGAILIGLLDKKPVGTCALIKTSDDSYELAKMAVSPEAQGRKIGWKIGLATIEKARELGANTIHLETNSSLKPAISLYHKLGFKETCGRDSPYSRCDVQMELLI